MISEEKVFEIWEKEGLSERVQEHTKVVNSVALEITDRLISDGVTVDRELVNVGSLLHDIGRSKGHDIRHGLEGFRILNSYNLDSRICRIARNHIGSGVSANEAEKLGLPEEDYLPENLEELIVAFADNMVAHNVVEAYEEVLEKWEKKYGVESEQVHRLKLSCSILNDYLTAQESKDADTNSGIPVVELMENAGRGIANSVAKEFPVAGKRVLIVCGSGNNGGDGYAAARYLEKLGAKVKIFPVAEPKTEEGKRNFKLVEEDLVDDVYECDIILDCLLGTGVEGEVREPIASAIRKINEKGALKVSVDIPSGISPDTGKPSDVFVDADFVVCLHRVKKGLLNTKWVAKLDVVDIGIPKSI